MSTKVWAEAIAMGDLLRRTAERFPDHDFMVFPDERVTYGEFAERVDILARALSSKGIEPGDHVGILMPNSIEFVEVLFASASIGALTVPVNARFKSHELGYVIENADIKILFTSDSNADFVDFPQILEETFGGLAGSDAEGLRLPQAPLLQSVVLSGAPRPGFVSMADFLRKASATPAQEIARLRAQIRLKDPVVLMYTSGTTAKPKGCLLTHESVVRNGLNFAHTRFMLTEADRFWDPLPFFHMSIILPLMACVATGAAMLVNRRFEPAEALKALEAERAS